MIELKVPVTEEDHMQGNKDAPVTLLEYGDYECGYCGMAHPQVKQIQKYFGNNLCFVFRHFPLAQIHPHAEPAAETAEFAASYDQFWEMHDRIYENQDQLSLQLFSDLATELNLPALELPSALKNRIYYPIIRNHFLSGVRNGVNGTPTFFINGYRQSGVLMYEDMVNAINKVLVE